MKRDCDDLFTWANAYDGANFNERQAILHQFIKEVRVGRDYDVEIILNELQMRLERASECSLKMALIIE